MSKAHNVVPFTRAWLGQTLGHDLTEAECASVVQMALEILEKRFQPGEALGSPEETKAFLRLRCRDLEAEVFGVIFLDNRHRILACEHMFYGTISGCTVHPREVIKTSLKLNSAAVILFHNHPSQACSPSKADEMLTARLKTALEMVDIRLLDHIIVSASESVSFSDRGLI